MNRTRRRASHVSYVDTYDSGLEDISLGSRDCNGSQGASSPGQGWSLDDISGDQSSPTYSSSVVAKGLPEARNKRARRACTECRNRKARVCPFTYN